MKRKNTSKLLASLLVSLVLTGCGHSTAKDTHFTYWLGTGDDTSYYATYDDNPVVKYLTKYNTWGEDKASLSLEFQTPPAGSQLDNINTIIASGDYTDIIDTTFYKQVGTVTDLYDQGIALDLTPYKEYLPNYLGWIDKHPSYKKTMFDKVDGESKILQLYVVSDTPDYWGGFCYRRDWIAHYGKNPTTGAAFTGAWSNGVWTDDVVFPSGGSDPVYISDWEWMFDIFDKAIEEQNISSGFPFSMYQYGYHTTGDLVTSFGGGGPLWYLNPNNNKVGMGMTEDGMRSYLECMSSWYKNGYLDKHFAERSDMFYAIDTPDTYSGKVGCWYGTIGNVGNKMDISDGKENNATNGYTNGISVYAARQPINDKYGTAATQNVDPYYFYRSGLVSLSIVLTDKAKDKDIGSLLTMIDYLYSDDGAMLDGVGLSKEQYEICKDPLYTKNGLTNGAYKWVDSDGNDWVEGTSTGTKLYRRDDFLVNGTGIGGAEKGNRLIGRRIGNDIKYWTEDKPQVHAYKEWGEYESNWTGLDGVPEKMDADTYKNYSKALNNILEFTAKNVPSFVNGSKNVNDDSTWTSFCNAINKYNVTKYTAALQAVYDAM